MNVCDGGETEINKYYSFTFSFFVTLCYLLINSLRTAVLNDQKIIKNVNCNCRPN